MVSSPKIAGCSIINLAKYIPDSDYKYSGLNCSGSISSKDHKIRWIDFEIVFILFFFNLFSFQKSDEVVVQKSNIKLEGLQTTFYWL